MATVSSLGNTINTNAGSKTVVATPALGDIIIVAVCATGVATALGISDNNSDGHGAAGFYNQITSALKNTSADNMAFFVRSQPIRSATSTTWTTSGDSASTGGGAQVFKVTGMTISGIAAIRQFGSQENQAGSTTPAAALSVGAALTTNSLIAAVFNGTNPAGVTVPASWTSSLNTGYATPTTGFISAFINTGFTGSTVTWGSATTVYSDIAIEISAAQGNLSVSPEIPEIVAGQAVKRGAFF